MNYNLKSEEKTEVNSNFMSMYLIVVQCSPLWYLYSDLWFSEVGICVGKVLLIFPQHGVVGVKDVHQGVHSMLGGLESSARGVLQAVQRLLVYETLEHVGESCSATFDFVA